MSRRRVLTVLVAGLTVAAGVAGCRTSPNVAAYVGEDEVTVDQLSAAVDERLADPDIAAYAADDEAGYVRAVLGRAVTAQLYDDAVRQLDLEVSDREVDARLAALLVGSDEAVVYTQLAQQQGVNEADVRQQIRQEVIKVRAAEAAGKADLSEAALQQRYEQSLADLTQTQLGVITVPDQATADAVLAQLTADPAAYPAVAAQFPGTTTLPEIRAVDVADLNPVLAEPFSATAPGQGFTRAVPEFGGVVVGYVAGTVVPSFADVREDLAGQAATEAADAGAALIEDVHDDIRVTVNPRYGVLDDTGRLVDGDGGVVQLLEGADATAGTGPVGGSGD